MGTRKERLFCISTSIEGMQYVWQHEDMPLFAKGNFIVQEEKVQFAYLYFTSTFLTLWTSTQGQIFVSATIYFNELPIYTLTAAWGKMLTARTCLPFPFWVLQNPLHPKNTNGNLHINQVSGRCGGAEGCEGRPEAVAQAGCKLLMWRGFFVGSLSWAILGNQRGALKLLTWKAEWQWKRGLGEKADANFVTDLSCQGEISAHFFLKQNVISSPPTPQKWVADGKKTWGKPNGCGGQKRIQRKRAKAKNVKIGNGGWRRAGLLGLQSWY